MDYPFGTGTGTGPASAVEALFIKMASLTSLEFHIVVLKKDLQASITINRDSGFQLHFLKGSRLPVSLFLFLSRRKILNRLRAIQPDIIHLHTPYFYFKGLNGLCRPLLLTVHGIFHKEKKYLSFKSKILSPFIQNRYYRAVRSIPNIIAISPYVVQELGKKTRSTFIPIPNVIHPEFFDIESENQERRLLFVGHLSRRKNILGLIRLLAEVRKQSSDIKLELAGAFQDRYYKRKVLKEIERKNLREDVIFLGSLSRMEVKKAYARAILFVLISFEEVTPVVVGEAMAAGLPVVASNRCGIPDMIENGRTGFLVDPNDMEDVSGAVIKLIGDAALRKSMGEQAKIRARVLWHPENRIGTTLRVYERIMRGEQ